MFCEEAEGFDHAALEMITRINEEIKKIRNLDLDVSALRGLEIALYIAKDVRDEGWKS